MLACRGCVEFLLEFERFADRCRLMDKMFGELSTSQHKDILALRNNYVLEFGKLQVSIWFSIYYLKHTNVFIKRYRNDRKRITKTVSWTKQWWNWILRNTKWNM